MVLDVLAGTGLLLLGGVIGLAGISTFRGYFRMAGTDPTDVAAVEPGTDEVELSGSARPVRDPFTAPLSGKGTLAYNYKVRRRGQGWSDIVSEGDAVPFLLDDGTGEIVVDPRGARWTFEKETWEVDDGEEPPGTIREFLERNDSDRLAASEVVYDGDRQFWERRLELGEDVYVYGPVRAGPAEDAPEGTVDPYVGAEEFDERAVGTTNVGAILNRDFIPGIGDHRKTLTMGGASEATIFTVSDTGEKAAQRRILKQGAILSVLGVAVAAAGVYLAFLA